VVIGVVLGAGPSSSQGASKPAKTSAAATVARRDLVSTDTESGTLGYASAQTVFNRLSGTITSLPAVGKVIDAGRTLYRVDGAPVVLFDGGTPAYRDLSAGVSDGLDVQELKQNLKTLGFDPDHQIIVNQTFDAATTAAVERWQSSLGQTQTGVVTLGQIVFLPGPQRITQVDTVLGSTGGASGGSAASGAATTASFTPATSSTGTAGTAVAAPRAEFVDLMTTTAASTPATTTTTPATTTTTPTTTTPTTTGTGSGKTTTTCPTSLPTGSGANPAMRQTESQILALCRQRTTASTKTAEQTLAALIALLNAETLQLKRGGSSSTGTGSGTSGSGASGGSGGGRSGGGSAAGSGASATGSSGGGSSGGGSSSGGSASAGGASAGSGGTAQAILQTTSTQLVVTVDLDATKQTEAVVGRPVTVQLPTGGTVDGKITGVSPVAQSASSSSSSSSSGGGGGGSSSSSPSATVPVTITLKGRQAETGLDQAAVSVNFEQQVENNVLSVPVTALLATSGGGYAVQELSAPHRLLPVTPGLFAAGLVQISGANVYPGLQVTDSQG
jgi:hypothetical protein